MMKKVLYVDCCIRGELSRTAQLAEAFLNHLPKEYEVQTLKLDEENLSAFSGAFFSQRERLLEEGELHHPRFRYAHQFAEADLIVIAAPLWDLSFPALLKVYIEQLCVDGITFGSTERGIVGLCKAEHMVYLTTRGGFYADSTMEMGSRYLDAMHTFFGIKQYTCIAADGMDVVGFDGEASLEAAKQKAAELAVML
ncbi:MAG: NAD(P)H-dependent oxidoreductase [Oscillospiraceae bacterium]|nr:NAD(P)H-dependent oxidoreductase [Oscillospiraceae bacterium]